VDGFDQDDAEYECEERRIVLRGLLATQADSLEALDLSDELFDARPRLVQDFRKELRPILRVLAPGDRRACAAFARGFAIGL
jgi:hypothetical protein